MKKPRQTRSAALTPDEGSRACEDEVAAFEESRRQQDEEFARVRAKREVHDRNAAEVKRWFHVPMDQRRHFRVPEVATAAARSAAAATSRQGDPLTSVDRQRELVAVIRQLADAILEGWFDNCGQVILPTSDAPLKPLRSEYFRVAAALYSGAADPDFLAAYIEPACITREGAVAFFQKQGYPWPADWGAWSSAESAIPIETRPAKQAAAIEAEIEEVQPATESVTRMVAQKRDIEAAYKLRIASGQNPTAAEDDAWQKKMRISRPRMRELRAKYRDANAKKGGHPKGRRTT